MLENFNDKIAEIESILNNFTYRNITVYGRIRVVKAIALSKVTHLIQIIPNPLPHRFSGFRESLINLSGKGQDRRRWC